MSDHHGVDEQSSFVFINACIMLAVGVFTYRRSGQIEPEVSLLICYRKATILTTEELAAIPTIGWSFFPLSFITAIIYIFDANRLIQEGYNKVRLRVLSGTLSECL